MTPHDGSPCPVGPETYVDYQVLTEDGIGAATRMKAKFVGQWEWSGEPPIGGIVAWQLTAQP